MTDQDQLTMADALEQISRRIQAFNDECEAAEHTDTGDAWDLLYALQALAHEALAG